MMLESMEPRRLRAASAVLVDGTLDVVGTDDSERIQVAASRVAFDTGGRVGRVVDYVVLVNDQRIAAFAAGRVRRINVFALGGNDRVDGVTPIGPKRSVGTIDDLTFVTKKGFDLLDVDDAKDRTVSVVPMYVEGGSGSDHLTGSYGNDTLKGGRGDDFLSDGLGRNFFDGGQGDDLVLTFRSGRVHAAEGTYVFPTAIRPRPARIVGGPGDDTVTSLGDDVLLDTPEHRPLGP